MFQKKHYYLRHPRYLQYLLYQQIQMNLKYLMIVIIGLNQQLLQYH
jgi:hypothetical protein